METIRSSSNQFVKRARAVAAGREPDSILLEGDRLVNEARRTGLEIEFVLVAETPQERGAELAELGVPVLRVEGELLRRVGTLETQPGMLAVARMPPDASLEESGSDGEPLLVVAAGIQDPGNLGALARTAEAAGASGLVVTGSGCSPWNPKALRGSMGSLLRLPVVRMPDPQTAAERIAARGFRQVRAATRDGSVPEAFDWSGPIAIWLSAESGALPQAAEAFEGLTIPIHSTVESLNVTAAATVLLFAAGRVQVERDAR